MQPESAEFEAMTKIMLEKHKYQQQKVKEQLTGNPSVDAFNQARQKGDYRPKYTLE
jgi:hypothetical protein